MEYQAIYRKWRPQVFEDIIGQSHITKTLKNQIMTDRISHAYLFCGTRGTGKTTAAKVFAKAVNCLNPQNGSPCNECEICRGISDGSILDVTEIDAASNNSVDNVREIREDVNYVASRTKYRVYIIDEVHMLSGGAFNALLKTIEEPPSHVIFILATTEVHKIPETILSRCQRFDFKRITPSDIIIRMKEIATADGISISDDAYSVLATLADGSMRDGLSILDRCISACGNNITLENITEILGITENSVLFSIGDSVIENDSQGVITSLDTVAKEGKNLNVFCDSLIKHFRDLIVCKISQNPEQFLDCSADLLVKLRSQAAKASYEKLSNAVTLLTKAKTDAKWVKNPRIIYELALIKLTRPELDSSQEALLDRLSSVEEKAKSGIVATSSKQKQEVFEENSEEIKKTKPSARLFVPLDKSTLTESSPIVVTARNWDKIVSSIVQKNTFAHFSTWLINRKITIDGEGIILLFSSEEKTKKNIASKYIPQFQEEFAKKTRTNFVIKTAFEKDIEDVMIDFWNIKKSEEDSETVSNPLDRISSQFSEIVEIEEDPYIQNSEQEELFDKITSDILPDDTEEEFLDSFEIEQMNSNENV